MSLNSPGSSGERAVNAMTDVLREAWAALQERFRDEPGGAEMLLWLAFGQLYYVKQDVVSVEALLHGYAVLRAAQPGEIAKLHAQLKKIDMAFPTEVNSRIADSVREEWDRSMAKQWVTGRAFPALVGRQYEVSFGRVTYQGQTGNWTARIRVDGERPSQWIDLDTGEMLDPQLAKFVVQAFIEL